MPRQARKTSGTGIYHVMLRGINRQDMMQSGSRIQTTGPNNGHQLRDYSKSSNGSENRPLILHKFGGKELDRSYGLDWYDVLARQYDPVVPSWHTVDPLAEKYYWISPYVYCTNNPVNAVYPDGKEKKNVFPNQNGQAEIAQKAIVDNFQDSPNTIVIFGHGDSNGIHIYGNNGDMIVNSVGSFVEYLDKESVVWQTRYVTGAKISIDADQQPGSVSFDMKYGKWGKSELINKDKMVPWK